MLANVSGPSCLSAEPAGGERVDFRREVLPILSENCFACHGFDEQAREAELRLDNFAGATDFAVVPGDPEGSELIARITSEDEDLRMPPPETEQTLTEAQKDILRRWIEQGAAYQEHWAFELPKATIPPTVEGVEHPIVSFKLDFLRLKLIPRQEPATRS